MQARIEELGDGVSMYLMCVYTTVKSKTSTSLLIQDSSDDLTAKTGRIHLWQSTLGFRWFVLVLEMAPWMEAPALISVD